jgi:acyl-CoA reductase-like NAD-dependent aldehyde dehydrogenase
MDKLTVFNPYTREVISELDWQISGDIETAIGDSWQLFRSGNRIPKHERIAILGRLYNLVRVHFDDLVDTAVREGGKPLNDTVVEVKRAMQGIRIAINTLESMHGEMVPMGITEGSKGRLAYTLLEPCGVVLAISAFNHPVNLIVHQVVSAVAIGAPVLIKPALKTPLSCLKLVGLLHEAGLPAPWCKVILCKNTVTERMVTDRRIGYVSFIGSHRVGWYLRSILAPGTRIALEHGGVAPVIIEKDADMEGLIAPLVKGAYYHAGQVCVSVQRIYVRKKMLDDFIRQFVQAAGKIITGDPASPQTDAGPLILPEEVERVEKWVQEAESEGAKIALGGKRISDVCFEPTVLVNPASYSYVTTEEVFGPVVSVYPYEKKKEAVEKANALSYSFQSAVWTNHLDRAMYYSHQLDANTVLINDHTAFRVDWMPFGGSQRSGLGTGGIQYSMRDMCKEKLVVIRSHSII